MGFIRDWGSTEAERGEAFPCDHLLRDADDVLFRAIDVAARPATVFRWLCQLRIAPYSYDLLDNYGRTSPRALTPGLDELAVGQRVMRIFELVAFEPGHHLTLVLDRARSVFGKIAVTYRVTPSGTGSRIVVKMRVRRPRGAMRLVASVLPAGDLFMMRKQLRTLKQLAEA
ncbi:MAG: SRPBCC family protein [Kofleriaceae bacterium]